MKKWIREHITTIFGLILLAFATWDLYLIISEEQAFEWMFTSGLVVVGLVLLLTSDRWLRSLFVRGSDKLLDDKEEDSV